MKYDQWQEEVIKARGDLLIKTGRQVGKTTVISHKIAKTMAEEPNTNVIVVSLTEDQAKLIIIMVLDYLEKHHKKDIITKGNKKKTSTRIWLRNGSSCISRPVGNTGDAVRGFTGDILYIDEASGMPEMMWKASMPVLMTTGGEVWMTSTPRGKFINNTTEKNFFFKCYENQDEKWEIFEINSEEVMKNRKIDEFWTQEKRDKSLAFLENQKKTLCEMDYRQEYLGEFLDDNRQWFEDQLIQDCMTEERPNKIQKEKTYYLGVDVARMGEDESTFEIFEMRDTHLYQVENLLTKKTTLPQTFQMIKDLHSLYDFSKVFIDSEGIGVGVYDWLMWDDDLKFVTESIDNSKMVISADGKEKKMTKTLKYTNVKMLMETGKIHLLDEPKIFQSFKSVQYGYSNDSLGKRHLKIFGNYTHIAEGAINAIWGAKTKHLNLEVHSIKV